MKLTEILYIPKAVNKLLSASRLVSNGATMGATQDKMNMGVNGVIMLLDSRKGKNASLMFYLKTKRYVPEGQVALTNLPEKNKDEIDKKEELRKKLVLSRKCT